MPARVGREEPLTVEKVQSFFTYVISASARDLTMTSNYDMHSLLLKGWLGKKHVLLSFEI